jgi:hypothetical protein
MYFLSPAVVLSRNIHPLHPGRGRMYGSFQSSPGKKKRKKELKGGKESGKVSGKQDKRKKQCF